jgi:hypothetical protein
VFYSCQPFFASVEFDATQAKAWRDSNYKLMKSITSLGIVAETIGGIYDTCMAASDLGFISVTPTCIVPSVLATVTKIAISAVESALGNSEQTYAEIVDSQDGDFAAEQEAAVYQNVVVIHGNVISTFTLVQQLQVMLGGIQEGLADDKDEKNRRLQLTDCTSTVNGYILQCNKPSCEDPSRLCDGSFNYKYISQLKSGMMFYTIICFYFHYKTHTTLKLNCLELPFHFQLDVIA